MAMFLFTAFTGAPYVPTHRREFEKSLDQLLPISARDTFIDLGAGDGVILNIVSKKGAKAIGVEINPILALFMKYRFRKNSKVKIKCRNFYHYQFPKNTTVVYAFAVGLHIEPIYRKIQSEATRLNKPIYFISNAFNLKSQKPTKHISQFYLYKITPKT